MSDSFFTQKNLTAFLLSIVSGYTDIAGFIGFGLFTAHITGNLALASVAIIQNQTNHILSRVIIVPVFIIGVILATAISNSIKDKRKKMILLLSAEIVFLITFMIIGIIKQLTFTEYNEKMIILLASPAVVAMGVQNSIRKDIVMDIFPTAVMTSNLTLFIIHLSKYLNIKFRKNTDPDFINPAQSIKMIKSLYPILGGFSIGGVLAGLLMPFFHYWSISIPIIIITFLILIYLRKKHT